MKVLIFTTLYPNNAWPNHGVFVKERMTHFAKLKNCEVKVVAPVPYFPPLKINSRWLFSQVAKKQVIEGLEVYHPRYLITPKLGMALYGFMMFLSVFSAVRRLHKTFNFDLIDAHYVYPDGFAAVLLGLLFNRPVVVSARGSDINVFRNLRVIKRALRFTLRKADRVIAVSQSLKDAMVDMGVPGEKITVIPNGVDINKFYPFSKAAARQKLGLPRDKQVILSVGNLNVNKGFDLLINAFKMVREQLNERSLCLIIVGEGRFRKVLLKMLSSVNLDRDVILTGNIPHQDLRYWYNAADLFCLTSRREGWPNVLLESLACGTPVVATAVGGIPEVISSQRLGLLMKGSAEDIAKGMSLALRQPWEREVLVEYARGRTWDKAALAVFAIFESVLNSRESFWVTAGFR